MYQDDYINDFMNEDFDDNKFSNKKLFEEMKKADQGYFSWKINVQGSPKPVKIESYASGDTGSQIRDAVTGERYKRNLVGSKDEDIFFKVKNCLNKSFTFFYSSPEEYEKHTKTILKDEIKEAWNYKKRLSDIRSKKEFDSVGKITPTERETNTIV